MSSVREALAAKELFVAVQPLVDLRKRDVFGYEALVRCSSARFKSPAQILKAALDEAMKTFRQGLAKDPRATGMRLGLARTLVDKGQPNEARTELQRVLDEKAPSNLADWTLKDAPEARKLLESLPATR